MKSETDVGGDDACPDYDPSHHAYDDVCGRRFGFGAFCLYSDDPCCHSFCGDDDDDVFWKIRTYLCLGTSSPLFFRPPYLRGETRETYDGDYDDYDDDYFWFCWISIGSFSLSCFLSPKMKTLIIFENALSRKQLSLSGLSPITTRVKVEKWIVVDQS